RACRHNACAARASCTPNSGEVNGGVDRSSHRSMNCVAADVLNLKQPAPSEVALYAGRPLFCIRRFELGRQHDVLRLRKEQGLGGSRDNGLRKWIGRDSADRPWARETQRTGSRGLRLADIGGKGWILIRALAGKEVNHVIGQLRACSNYSLAVTK